jgi:hypothetical protein
MADLLKIASALDKVADLYDAQTAEKTASEKQTRAAKVKDLSEKYASATGEELPVDVAEKLAAGDESVLKTVEKIVEKTSGAVESLGRSSERPDTSVKPTTKSDRAKAAWDRMGQFLNT